MSQEFHGLADDLMQLSWIVLLPNDFIGNLQDTMENPEPGLGSKGVSWSMFNDKLNNYTCRKLRTHTLLDISPD